MAHAWNMVRDLVLQSAKAMWHYIMAHYGLKVNPVLVQLSNLFFLPKISGKEIIFVPY